MPTKTTRIVITLFFVISFFTFTLAAICIHQQREPQDVCKITFLKVGKADAIVVQVGEKTMVMDVGEAEDGEEVVSFLTKQGISRVDVLIITHFDKDHVGGAATLVKTLEVDQVFLPDYVGNHASYQDFLASLDEKNIRPHNLTEPASLSLGDAVIQIEPPLSYETADTTAEPDNDFSLITTLTYGVNRFVFTGDAEEMRIRQWLSSGAVESCDLLKIPHHGKYNAGLEELVKAVSPRYAVICSSKKNPAQNKTLEVLKRYHAKVFQTKDGDVTVTSDGKHIEVLQNG